MKMHTLVITSLAMICIATLVSCSGSASSSPATSDPVVSEDNTTMIEEGTGAKLNHGTEMTTAFNGLALDNAYIVDGDDKKILTSQVALNSTFSIVYEGIKNYVLKDGKVFPGLSIQVTDNNGVSVMQEADLLTQYKDGLSEADASVLRATITVGDPMKVGKYFCTVQVVDKNNNDSAIVSTWEFDVK